MNSSKRNKTNGNKKYIAIDDTEYTTTDFLNNKKIYEILNKYKDYNISLKDQNKIIKKVKELMHDLYAIKIMCQNYQDFVDDINIDSIEAINKCDILQCLSIITFIQRKDYWAGGFDDTYYEYTNNNILPTLINRIIDLYLKDNS